MTDLSRRITRLRFTTASVVRERGKVRRVTIEARPEYAIVKLEGLRTAVTVPWDAVWSLACKMEVAAKKAEKKKAKS